MIPAYGDLQVHENSSKGNTTMSISSKPIVMLRPMGLILLLMTILAGSTSAIAQALKEEREPMPKMPFQIQPDPRVEQRKYHFKETNEELAYVLYVSSKVSKDKKNPLIVALHGLGGDGNFLVRDRLVDLAEEGGYIVAGPLGYNVSGWYGSPVIRFPKSKGSKELAPIEPPNLRELSEKDVMNVLTIMLEEFNVDGARTYLLGHSMGGAGALFLGSKYAPNWAAIAAIAPAAFTMLETRKEILSKIKDADLPAMIVQGEKDPAVPIKYTLQWLDTMRELGLDYKYVEFGRGDHGNVIGDGMPDIFRFFKEHTKQAEQ